MYTKSHAGSRGEIKAVQPVVRCLTTRRGNFGSFYSGTKFKFPGKVGMLDEKESYMYILAIIWWYVSLFSNHTFVDPTACINAMLSSISNTSKITTTGGETVNGWWGAKLSPQDSA